MTGSLIIHKSFDFIIFKSLNTNNSSWCKYLSLSRLLITSRLLIKVCFITLAPCISMAEFSNQLVKAALDTTLNKKIASVSIENEYLKQESQKCFHHVKKYEELYQLPKKSLLAIVLNETGRKYFDDKDFLESTRPWPWSVGDNTNKQSYFFTTKKEALHFIKIQMSRGNKNLDIGCAQINLKAHGEHFESVDQIIDPEINIHYAAYLIAGHYHNNGRNWYKSIAYYHSKTKEIGINYAKRVLKILSKLEN